MICLRTKIKSPNICRTIRFRLSHSANSDSQPSSVLTGRSSCIVRTSFLLCILVLFAAPQTATSRGFFCTRQGARLQYVRRYVSNDKVRWRHTMTIGQIDRRPDGSLLVSYSSDFVKANGRQMYGGPINLKANVGPDGTVTLDLAESLTSTLKNIFPKADVVSTAGITSLSPDLKPGDALPDVSAEAKLLGITYKVSVTDRHVLYADTLETKAGKFACLVVSEHKVEKAPAHNRTTTAHTWYSPEVGMVRHDTYDAKMVLETIEMLEAVE